MFCTLRENLYVLYFKRDAFFKNIYNFAKNKFAGIKNAPTFV